MSVGSCCTADTDLADDLADQWVNQKHLPERNALITWLQQVSRRLWQRTAACSFAVSRCGDGDTQTATAVWSDHRASLDAYMQASCLRAPASWQCCWRSQGVASWRTAGLACMMQQCKEGFPCVQGCLCTPDAECLARSRHAIQSLRRCVRVCSLRCIPCSATAALPPLDVHRWQPTTLCV